MRRQGVQFLRNALSRRPPSRPVALHSLRPFPFHYSVLARYVPASAGLTTSTLSSILLPPAVFAGLLVTLWTYKCLMLIIFQHKIIYMPFVPPFARSERLSDYEQQCKPVVWREEWTRARDGTELVMAVGQRQNGEASDDIGRRSSRGEDISRDVVVVYLQGNGGSTPPRLPLLSQVLQRLDATQPLPKTFQSAPHHRHTLVALSYRGYWRSRGRPSEHGLALDAAAALEWVSTRFPTGTPLVLWGQSLGAAVAVAATANTAEQTYLGDNATSRTPFLPICGVVLETPFVSMRRMLAAHYPQRWVPYRYLWPFLRHRWDSTEAVRRLGSATAAGRKDTEREGNSESLEGRGSQREGRLPLLLIEAGKDEVVPAGHAEELEVVVEEVGLDVNRVVVDGALHNGIMGTSTGRKALASFVRKCSS